MGDLTPAQQHILTSQIMDENQPGTILRDFETLLAVVGDQGTPVGQKHQVLPHAFTGAFQAFERSLFP